MSRLKGCEQLATALTALDEVKCNGIGAQLCKTKGDKCMKDVLLFLGKETATLASKAESGTQKKEDKKIWLCLDGLTRNNTDLQNMLLEVCPGFRASFESLLNCYFHKEDVKTLKQTHACFMPPDMEGEDDEGEEEAEEEGKKMRRKRVKTKQRKQNKKQNMK